MSLGLYGADVGPDGEIHLPAFSMVDDYDTTALVGFKPPEGYISARLNTPTGRFGAGAPAALYTATSDDTAWLAGVNAPRGGAVVGETPAFLKEQQLEQLFDVFEEASWHAGEMVPSAAIAYDILGYSTSVAEAEEAAASAALTSSISMSSNTDMNAVGNVGQAGKGAALTACVTDTAVTDIFSCGAMELSWAEGEGDLPLMSPMAMDATAAGAWDAVDAYPVKASASGAGGHGEGASGSGVRDEVRDGGGGDGDEDGFHGSELSDSPPLTPNGSVEPGAFASNGACACSDKDSLEGEGDDISAPPSTPGVSGSESASAEEDTDLDLDLDGSDDERDVEGKLGNGKSSDLATSMKTTGATRGARTTRGGAKATATIVATKEEQMPVAGIVVVIPQAVNRGASELDKIVNNKNNTNNTNNINTNNTITTATATTAIYSVTTTNGDAPSAADVTLVYEYYCERRAANDGVALLPRFECPAPPSVRACAQLGRAAGGDGEEDRSSCGGGSEDGDVASRGGEAVAGAGHHGEKYQFVLGEEAVRRQQRERAMRGEANAAAARRRRRRACFNPAASKRRRKQQVAMEVAVTAPVIIVYEPFDDSMLDNEIENEEAEVEPELGPDATMEDALEKVGEETGEAVTMAMMAAVAPAEELVPERAAGGEEEGADSEWESDDDVPLATLAERDSSPAPTLAAIAIATKAKAKMAKAAEADIKAAVKCKGSSKPPPAPKLTSTAAGRPSSPGTALTPADVPIPSPSAAAATASAPSAMPKVARVASVVMSRAQCLSSTSASARPALHLPVCGAHLADVDAAPGAVSVPRRAAAAIAALAVPSTAGRLPLPLNPTTPRRRRTPRFGGDRSGSGSPRVPFLAGESRASVGPVMRDAKVEA
jgi:hypothetical protein